MMEEDFKCELIKIIEHLFNPKNLVTKKINQLKLTGADYLTCAEIYFQTFKSKQKLNVKTVFENIIEGQLNAIVESCVEKYKSYFDAQQNLITEIDHIKIFHERSKYFALYLYSAAYKLGKPNDSNKFKEFLETKLETAYEEQKKIIINKILEDKRHLQETLDEKDKKVKENLEEIAKRDLKIQELNQQLLFVKEKFDKELQIKTAEVLQESAKQDELVQVINQHKIEIDKAIYEKESINHELLFVKNDLKVFKNESTKNQIEINNLKDCLLEKDNFIRMLEQKNDSLKKELEERRRESEEYKKNIDNLTTIVSNTKSPSLGKIFLCKTRARFLG